MMNERPLARRRQRQLVDDARLASIRIDAGRIEIALYDADPQWIAEARAKLEGSAVVEYFIHYRNPDTDTFDPLISREKAQELRGQG